MSEWSVIYNCCWLFLGSESRGTCDLILLSQIRDIFFVCRLWWHAGLRWRYWTQSPHGNLYWSALYSLGLTVDRSLVSAFPLPCCTDFCRGCLITEPLRSSECFLATFLTIVLEVRCRCCARTSGRLSCRYLRWLASAWLKLDGSRTMFLALHSSCMNRVMLVHFCFTWIPLQRLLSAF
jgi:hypothetical protein